jgi:hypothetical protein
MYTSKKRRPGTSTSKLYFCKCLEADCVKETSTKIGVVVIPAYKQKARRREEKILKCRAAEVEHPTLVQ